MGKLKCLFICKGEWLDSKEKAINNVLSLSHRCVIITQHPSSPLKSWSFNLIFSRQQIKAIKVTMKTKESIKDSLSSRQIFTTNALTKRVHYKIFSYSSERKGLNVISILCLIMERPFSFCIYSMDFCNLFNWANYLHLH